MSSSTSAQPALTVVVPAYNEEECLDSVLAEIVTQLDSMKLPGWELVVVDDGSRDNTAGVVEARAATDPRVRVIRHTRNRGQGGALSTGFTDARGQWVTWLPADGQIPASDLATIWDAANGSDAPDFVTTYYRNRDDGLVRTILSAGLSSMIWIALRVWAFNGGVFAFRRTLWQQHPARTDTMMLGCEFRFRLRPAGIRYNNVPINCVPRRAGNSKSANFRTIVRTFEALVKIRLAP